MLYSVVFALRSLSANRMRSALAVLGIVIGVASVVVMSAVGIGARENIEAQIRSLGSNLISVNPASALMGSVRLASGAAPNLSEDDALAIEREIGEVWIAAPLLFARGQFTVGAANWSGSIRGATPSYLEAREWRVVEGRAMHADDHARAARVVLLGATMRERLFDSEDPSGVSIRIRDIPFTVIGILERKGHSVWGDDQDDVAIIPLTTARRQLAGTSRANPRQVHNLTIKLAADASPELAIKYIQALLRERHKIRPGQEDSFVISNLAEAAEVEAATTKTISLLLLAVALVSLLVGGIGIMNIMLVTVTERTREIGLRVSVGARQRDIIAQFLVEATILALAGGVIGAFVGAVASMAIGIFFGWPTVIDLRALLVAVVFSGSIGVFFGYAPARRAAKLEPIDALRAE
jgi:putative ABC transport system permease protein